VNSWLEHKPKAYIYKFLKLVELPNELHDTIHKKLLTSANLFNQRLSTFSIIY